MGTAYEICVPLFLIVLQAAWLFHLAGFEWAWLQGLVENSDSGAQSVRARVYSCR
jgi:hypothetical protein